MTRLHFAEKRLALLAARLDGLLHLVVGDGVNVLEGQVFELAANLAHAQAMRDGRVDFQGLARDLHLPLGREELQGAHVVQAVSQLNEHDANVVHHGQHHLAHVLGLRLFRRGEIDFADLGDALDDVSDLFAELGLDLVVGDLGVFHCVVQQAGGDGGGIQPHLRQQHRNLQGMHQVRLAGFAHLAFMMIAGRNRRLCGPGSRSSLGR